MFVEFFTAPDDACACALVDDPEVGGGFEGYGRCGSFLDMNDLLVFIADHADPVLDGQDGGAVVVRFHQEVVASLAVTSVECDPLFLEEYADLEEIVERAGPVVDLARQARAHGLNLYCEILL